MRRRSALLVLGTVSGLLLSPREAHLSQIHYRTITLAELVESSELVLVVKTAKPARRQVEIPVGDPVNPPPVETS
jgi:hypothetical protein